MAEFVQMMKDWRRMCKDRSCGSCNLRDSCNIDPDSWTDADIQKIDTKVKIWAAEHPEPVYPAWRDWLRDLYGNPNMTMTDILESPIDPEIAQRLNIVPRRIKE